MKQNPDIVSRLLRIQKALGYNDSQMARAIGCSRQLFQKTRTGKIPPGTKVLTFFITGDADRLAPETHQDSKLGSLKGLLVAIYHWLVKPKANDNTKYERPPRTTLRRDDGK